MTTLLFVHGTSVRESAHDATLGTVKKHVGALGRGWTVETCYWGTALGAALSDDGASVPNYSGTRNAASDLTTDDDDVALWSVLYADPLYELRILRLRPAPPQPFGPPPADSLLRDMAAFAPSPGSRSFFESLGLATSLDEAVATVAESAELVSAATTASADPVEHRQAIARAIVAETLSSALAKGLPAVSGWIRDRLVDNIAADLKADVLGVSDWLRTAALSVVARLATPALVAHRGSLTDATTPGIGDILRFLARPLVVEGYLAGRISDLRREDLYLLGHSLGGILCVDLLARGALPPVRGLITVGSQAPYFHEIGALPALAPNEALPAHMPSWLNIYDRRDLLSYLGGGVFQGRVTDVEVDSNQPFPQSHSAYWGNEAVWNAIAEFIPI